MGRKRLSWGERKWNDFVEGILVPYFTFLVLGLLAWMYLNPAKAKTYSFIALGIALIVLIIVIIIYLILKKRKKQANQAYLDDDILLHSFHDMTGYEFEDFVDKKVFSKLGYETQRVGGSGDGGIDIVAKKDGKKYLIQCKDWNVNHASPVDVSRLHSAVIRERADKGIFVAVGGYTTQARAEFEKEPKMELIDGQGIIDLYKEANQN